MTHNNDIAPRSAEWREELRKALTAKQRGDIPRVAMPELDPAYHMQWGGQLRHIP